MAKLPSLAQESLMPRSSRIALITLALAAALLLGQARPPRSAGLINLQLQDADADLAALGSQDDLLQKDKRAELGPQALPLLKKQNQLIDELAHADPASAPNQYFRQIKIMAALSLLGDEETTKRLDALAKTGGPKEAAAAKIGQTLRDWYNTSTDAESQKKLIDSLDTLIKANPKDDLLTAAAFEMKAHSLASPDLADTLDEILLKDAASPAALAFRLVPKIGRPMTVLGSQLTAAGTAGPAFTTASWKGKVILVYVWRMGDRTARQRLGPLKTLLAARHDKGLEALGIASEPNLKDLVAYLQERELTIPQLVDPKNPAWHPLNAQWQIDHLPRLYIIDRNGILRATNPPDDQLPTLLDQFIEEKPAPATQPKK